MSLRMSDLSGSTYSTPTRSRFSGNYGSSFNDDSQNKKNNTKQLSSDILSSTLAASTKKQNEKSELFDIELEDSDYYKADRTIEEINMLAAKSYAYSKNSGLTDFKPNDSPQNSYEEVNEVKFGFIPIKSTPTRNRTPKYNKYDLDGKSFFSEPHVYPRKPASQAYQDTNYTEMDEPFGNFEFFRATPVRRPPSLL